MKKLLYFLPALAILLLGAAVTTKYVGTFVGNGLSITNLNTGWGRSLVVATNGSDSTGNRLGLPFRTITAAKTAAVLGDTIYVKGGNYSENNLLKPGVNYFFYPGCSISYTCSVSTIADGYGIFDDRATGATTNKIYGSVDIYYSCGTNLNVTTGCYGNTNALAAVLLTNANTDLVLQFGRIDGDCFATCQPADINGIAPQPSLIYISHVRRCELRGLELAASRMWDTPNGNGSALNGFYWELGETYFTCNHIYPFNGGYGIWLNEPTGTHVENVWINGQLCEGYIYHSGSSLTWRAWETFQELSVTNSGTGAAYEVDGGAAYLQASKIEARDSGSYVANITIGGNAWITAQKMTCPSGGSGWVNVNASTAHVNVLQYQAIGSVTGSGFLLGSAGVLVAKGFTVNTNFVSGFIYTNFYGTPIEVNAQAALTTTTVSGAAALHLEIYGYRTNQVGISTVIGSIGQIYTNMIVGVIPVNGTYAFTNKSSGSGDSATVGAGQIVFH